MSIGDVAIDIMRDSSLVVMFALWTAPVRLPNQRPKSSSCAIQKPFPNISSLVIAR